MRDDVADRGTSPVARLAPVAALQRLASSPWRLAIALVVVTRILLVIISAVAIRLRPVGPRAPSLLLAWARYDATYYARLAHDNYLPQVPWRDAFFPLQPLATRLVTLPFHGAGYTADYIGSIIVANVACVVAFAGIATLAGGSVGWRAMVLLAASPVAFFLFLGYAESLFLALAIWCIVAIRRHAWWQAAALGMLASLTRQMGVFLVLPFAWEYLQQAGWRWRGIRMDALWAALIPGGLLLFMGWLWLSVGDPLAFVHAEHYWQHVFTLPWQTLGQSVVQLAHPVADRIVYLAEVVDIVLVVAVAVLLVVGARLLSPGELAYSAAVWLLAVCYPTQGWPLTSDARYMLLAFPVLLVAERVTRGHRFVWWSVILVCAVVQAVLFQYFVRGAPII